jgi:Tfp pilus assembly protein PilN
VKQTIAVLALAALAGCGLETTGAAASGAAIKKQELEQGKKTMEQAQQKIGQALEQQQRAQPAEDSAEK